MTEQQRPLRSSVADQALAARLMRLQQRAEPTGPRTRRHPAKAARYSAIGMSALSLVGLTSLFVNGAHASSRRQIVSATATVVGPNPGVSNSVPSPPDSVMRNPTVIDGATFANRWGNVQVEATFAPDGSLLSVAALQAPDGKDKSVRINQQAVPLLVSEAVAIQNAQVHTISGATYTSVGYRQSLQSAIDAARAANATTLT